MSGDRIWNIGLPGNPGRPLAWQVILLGRRCCAVLNLPPGSWWEAVTIRAVRITVYLFTFAAVIGIAAAISWLSIIVAPLETKQRSLTLLALALGGLGVAGGVVYLAEKLINLAKGVAFMLAEIIVERFKRREREV